MAVIKIKDNITESELITTKRNPAGNILEFFTKRATEIFDTKRKAE